MQSSKRQGLREVYMRRSLRGAEGKRRRLEFRRCGGQSTTWLELCCRGVETGLKLRCSSVELDVVHSRSGDGGTRNRRRGGIRCPLFTEDEWLGVGIERLAPRASGRWTSTARQ